MRFSRSGYGPLLVVALALVALGAACGDSNVGPPADDLAAPPTTGTLTTAPATPSPDGLDCESEVRIVGHGDPAPEFAGHATPEEAVLAVASTFSMSGIPRILEGDTWILVSDDGLTIARTDVGPWQSGWIAGEIVACDVENAATDEGAARETLLAFFSYLHEGRYVEAAELYGGSYDTPVEFNPVLEPAERAALLRNACTVNGFACMRPATVTLHDSNDDFVYQFLVEFEENDGSLFAVLPCCGGGRINATLNPLRLRARRQRWWRVSRPRAATLSTAITEAHRLPDPEDSVADADVAGSFHVAVIEFRVRRHDNRGSTVFLSPDPAFTKTRAAPRRAGCSAALNIPGPGIARQEG